MNSGVQDADMKWYVYLGVPTVFFGILLWFVLAGARYGHTDAGLLVYPFVTLLKERLFTSAALWNDLNFHGFPSLYFSGILFQPILSGLLLFLGSSGALHLTIYIQTVLGAFLFSRSMRKTGFSPAASVLCGVLYPLVLWPWNFELGIQTVIPLLAALFFVETHIPAGKISRFFAVALLHALAGLLLHMHYVLLFYLAGFGLMAWLTSGKNPLVPALKKTMIYLGAVLFGSVIGTIRLVPVAAYAMLSTRTGWWAKAGIAVKDGFLGWGDALYLFFPNLLVKGLPQQSEIPVYLGPLALVFIVYAVARFRDRSALVKACGSVVLVILLFLSIRQFVYRIPILMMIGSPTRFMFLAVLAVLPLVGAGFDELVRRPGSLAKKAGIALFILAAALPAFRFNITSVNAFPGLAALIIAGWILFNMATELPDNAKKVFSMKLMILTLALLVPPYLAVTLAGVRIAPFDEKSEIVRLLKTELGGDDIFFPYLTSNRTTEIWDKGTPYTPQFATAMMVPNTNIYWGFQSAGYFDPLSSRRMTRLLGMFGGATRIEPVERLENFKIGWKAKTQRMGSTRALVNILNITHIGTFYPLNWMGYDIKKVLYVTGLKPGLGMVIFKNSKALPLVYFLKKVRYLEPDPDEAYGMLVARPWTSGAGFVECGGCSGEKIFSGSGKISITDKKPTHLEMETESMTDQQLVISLNNLPGWSLKVDGQIVFPEMAFSVYPSIRLSPGTHKIVWEFDVLTLLKDSLEVLFSRGKSRWT